jgi:hypothetical protein
MRTDGPVTGAYQSGEPIEASGGTASRFAAAATASPRLTRP